MFISAWLQCLVIIQIFFEKMTNSETPSEIFSLMNVTMSAYLQWKIASCWNCCDLPFKTHSTIKVESAEILNVLVFLNLSFANGISDKLKNGQILCFVSFLTFYSLNIYKTLQKKTISCNWVNIYLINKLKLSVNIKTSASQPFLRFTETFAIK